MNVVVTGATSFLGAPMTERFLRDGDRVYAVVRPGSRNMGRVEKLRERYGGRIIPVSVKLEDTDRIADVIKEPCSLWVHFGWDGAGSGNRTQRDTQQKNAEDSLRALRGAETLGCRRFVFSGSQAEYGIRDSLMKESDPCRPVSEYGKAKVRFYQAAREYLTESGSAIEYVHARIFSVYGPGDHPWSLVESCRKAFLAGEEISLGECAQMWNFLYRDDCLEALFLLAKAQGTVGFSAATPSGREKNGIYNVAAPEAETRLLRSYVETMYRLCGSRGSFVYGVRPPNAEGQANLIPSTQKLRETVGFAAKIGFEDGFLRLLETEATR